MVEKWSPFEGLRAKLPAVGTDLLLTIEEVPALYSLQAKAKPVEKELGLPADISVGEITTQDNRHLICLGPDKWLLITDRPIPNPGPIAVDITQTRCWLRLEGLQAEALLNKLSNFDFKQLHVGNAAATELVGVQVVIVRNTNDGYLIGSATTHGPFLAESLIDAITFTGI